MPVITKTNIHDKKLIIAAVQMCSTDNVNANLATAAKFIQEAAEQKASMVVLPEMFAIMGASAKDKVIEKERFGDGKIQRFLSEQAKTNKIWIIGGTIPVQCNHQNKVRAACLVFNSDGNCVARYDKIHLFDVTLSEVETYKESDSTEAGDEIIVVDTPLGKLGLAVCYDIRFPELFRCLINKGAEIIAIPSAFTTITGKAHWEILTRSRAIENFCYIIGACQGGTHADGKKTYGHSIIVEPWGAVAAIKDGIENGVIYSIIDQDKISLARKSIPSLNHQQIFKTK